MAPILSLPEPLIPTLLDRHLAAAVEWFPHELVRYEVGTHRGNAPWCADDSPFGPAVRTVLQLNLLTEGNLPYYHLLATRIAHRNTGVASYSIMPFLADA